MHIFTNQIKILSLFSAFVLGALSVSAQQTDSLAKKAPDSAAVVAPKNNTGLSVSGTITDATTGKPISGINVAVYQYQTAAITDDKGGFTVQVPAYTGVLIVSGQGYQTKELPIKGRKVVSTTLYEDGYNSVYSIANTPLGQKSIYNLPNSVTTINTNAGWETANETADSYLQGKVAGLNAIRRSGTPNSGADLYLRGYSSILATNKPLIVVDGMIYDNSHYGTSLIGGHSNNPLANIDFNDIDNFTVLKDGVSMYGTKAANGVIIISTGHSTDLATHIDFGVYSGFNVAPKNIPVLGTNDYRVYLSDIQKTSGLTAAQIQAMPYYNDNINSGTYYNYHNNTDWQKEVFKNSYNQNYYLRVSGGDNIARYTLSMGYGTNGAATDNTSLNRYNTRFNANLNLTRKFTVEANLSFTYNEQNLFDQGLSPKSNPIYLALTKAPFLTTHQINGAGDVSPNLENLDIFNTGNPRSVIDTAQDVAKSYRFFGNLNFKYQFNRYVSLQSLLGVTYDKVRESTFLPRAGVQPDTLGSVAVNGKNAILYSHMGTQVQRLYSIYNDTHFSYDRVYNRIHHVTASVGARFLNSTSADDYARGYNSATDQFISVGTGINTLRTTGGELGDWRYLNNYLGVDYQLLNKYFLSYNMAVDASSRFGSQISGALSIGGLKMAVLPSISAGWLISSEKFMSDISFIELLKLRASYGITGNDDIGNYAARQYYIPQNLLGVEGLVRGNIGNSNLQWEVNKKANIGLDASILQDRITIAFDVFQNTTTNMLTNDPQAQSLGFTNAVTNGGGMRTRGVELSLTGRIIANTRLKWDLGLNIASFRNVVTQLPNNSMQTNYAGATILTQVGMPANLFYGYKTNGVYRSDAEALASGVQVIAANSLSAQPHGGDVRFVDVNGDKVIDANDKQVIGNPNPDFVGSINSTLTYKRVSFSALFTFSKGNQIFNYTRQQLEGERGYQNQTINVLNRWQADGQVTNVPRAVFGDPIANSRFSDRWIEDGSYLRLRTVNVTYNVPIKAKGALKAIKVYATANNVFTLTKYLGYDPEFSATDGILTQGIDTGLEPQFTSIQLGIRIGL
jgi:TonB-linked SusC/RagA family outer membrane protein